MPVYAELQVSSNFSFLRGASDPRELMQRASDIGLHAVALTDRNTLSGIVLAHTCMKKNSRGCTRFVVGCRLDLSNGESILCYPSNRAGYGRLTRLLTRGRRRAEKGKCELNLMDVAELSEGMQFILPFPDVLDESRAAYLQRCAGMFAGNIHLALTHSCRGDDQTWIRHVADFARSIHLPTAVTNDVLYHDPERKELQDVVTCIREHCTLREAGFRLQANAERYLKSPEEMWRLFGAYPQALEAAAEIADACRFSLDELRYVYPEEKLEEGFTPFQTLERRVWAGAEKRYPGGITDAVRRQIEHELKLIRERDYAAYFLTVHDIVEFANEKGILNQGRGSAANSIVCYCLHITQVDPVKRGLLFERFISEARNEPPDIDVDFEHDRREEVIQEIYRRYGRDRAGLTATVVHYRPRRAIREVGKVFGISEEVTGAIARLIHSWGDDALLEEHIRQAGVNPKGELLSKAIRLSRMLVGFPRHLSQHVGGFVISHDPLEELVPIENASMKNRTVIQWEKDDLDEVGMMKVDILGLGMLTAIRRSFQLLREHYGRDLNLSTISQEDPGVYEMLQRTDSIGVFQVESRAQQSMLPRLKPKTFYDLVIEVAIVRPGLIQGDMVHPYLRRREGKEPVDYPSKELEAILKKTLGVPLFQEQAMQIAIVGAGFSPAEADELRRSLATFRHVCTIASFQDRFIIGMCSKGYDKDFAVRCFEQIKGFGNYGFPEAHAISFANLVYVSAWLKYHYPEVFCASLLNSQPMGFYAPAQLVQDARRHGVEIRPVDINHSMWDCTLEPVPESPRYALRLGFRMVKGFSERDAEKLISARGSGYISIEEIVRRTGCGRSVLDRLAQADALRSIGAERREALWKTSVLQGKLPPLAMYGQMTPHPETAVELPAFTDSQHVVRDYWTTGLSLRNHPLYFLRGSKGMRGVVTAEKLQHIPHGRVVTVAGLVLSRQQPMTAKSTVFMTLEDETGTINVIIWKDIHDRFRSIVRGGTLLCCRGELQREGSVMHVIAKCFWDWTDALKRLHSGDATPILSVPSRDFH
jgi:error-prone DNA polymerase